jgi:hypothetical protein
MQQMELFPDSSYGRTSSVPSQAIKVQTSQRSSTRWQKSGRWTSDGECWTRAGSECPSVVVECSLSQILQADAPERYRLSPRACAGILTRVERRGRAIPAELREALQAVASRST